MRSFRFMRVMLLALLVCVIPATSNAAVFISVGFAPPPLPVYEQPPCPEAGWMWTPGYWAYGPDGYYWVPGTWVPAPYEGALWTPGYWGWGSGLYVWHPGYWGRHVGYYGGVNYGFGFFGVGFAGGMWSGGAFRYNTAVMHVGPGIHNTYVDRTVIERNTIVNNNRVAFSGGPGGINHPPTVQENAYSHEQHMAATSVQTQHESTAMHNVNNYASHNGGRPANLASARPAGGNAHGSINYNASKSNTGNRTAPQGQSGNTNQRGAINYNSSKSNSGNRNMGPGGHGAPSTRTYNASHSNTSNHPAPQPQSHGGQPQGGQPHPQPQFQAHSQPHPQPQMNESRPAPRPQTSESRPAPQHGGGGGGGGGGHGHGKSH